MKWDETVFSLFILLYFFDIAIFYSQKEVKSIFRWILLDKKKKKYQSSQLNPYILIKTQQKENLLSVWSDHCWIMVPYAQHLVFE
jgi:hypothetical protein